MKKVYILRSASLTKDNEFKYYDIDVFSSMENLMEEVDRRVEINRGSKIEEYETAYSKFIEYECPSYRGDMIKVRYEIIETTLK